MTSGPGSSPTSQGGERWPSRGPTTARGFNFSNYFWIPIVGPLIGGVIGVLIYDLFVGDVLYARLKLAEDVSGPIEETPGEVRLMASEHRVLWLVTPPTGLPPGCCRRRRSTIKEAVMPDFVGAVDQGTTSSRFMLFDHSGNEVAKHQLEHEQILPQAGWVEHNPVEIWERTVAVIQTALNNANLGASDLAALGITNQRETTVVWNRRTGRPYYNAIVWQDTRTDRIASALDRDERGGVIRRKAGLPPATYFSGGKIQWILENVDGVREAAENGDAIFGNTDSWVIWNLTGGPDGGSHVTDVTNASRTMLMNLETLDWDDELLGFFNIPRAMLPEIRPSSDPRGYGEVRGPATVRGVPLTGDLGDQQAATVGQVCFGVGEAKNTYGTGNFMLLNTGEELVRSKNGLLTTVCYKFGDQKPIYALEGSIAVTGIGGAVAA